MVRVVVGMAIERCYCKLFAQLSPVKMLSVESYDVKSPPPGNTDNRV
jgi:hypothetical protein